MIVTVTANPSMDRTVTLAGELQRGAVHRVTSVTSEPGGKGVNVARALTLAGIETVAVLPAAEHDPILAALAGQGVPFHAVPTTQPVRTNIAITENDGTTTKVNEPGAALESAEAEELAWAVLARAGGPLGGAVRIAATRPARQLVRRDGGGAESARLQGRGGHL